jgi:hypothetical protein
LSKFDDIKIFFPITWAIFFKTIFLYCKGLSLLSGPYKAQNVDNMIQHAPEPHPSFSEKKIDQARAEKEKRRRTWYFCTACNNNYVQIECWGL